MINNLTVRRLATLGLATSAGLWLAGCNDGNTAPPVPVPAPPPVVPAPPPAPVPVPMTSVTLSGRVIDQPIPNATVVATVADQSFSTVADGDGNYRLPITLPTAQAASTLMVVATGTGAQSTVQLVSLPGSLATVASDAGADGVLMAAENIRANVTHVSTAEAVLVMELAGGATPSGQDQLDMAKRQLDPVQLFDLAATIKLIVDTADYELPAGVTNTLAFAQNTAVRTDYIEEIQANAPERLEQAKQDTISSADAVPATTASDIPAKLYAAVINSDARVSANSFNAAAAFTFAAGGTGSYYDATGFTATRWSLTGNQIGVVLNQPITSTGFPTVDTDGDGNPDRQVRADTTQTGFTLTLLSDALVSVTSNFSVVYPNGEVPNEPNQTATDSATLVVPAVDFAPFLPTGFASNGGSLMSSTFVAASSGSSQFSGDIFSFGAGGTGSSRVLAKSFSWSVSAATGTLSTSFADGTTVRYDGLATDFINQDLNTAYVFAEITTPTASYVDIVKVIAPSNPLVFNAATLQGRYFLFGAGAFEAGSGFDERLMGTAIDLAADRTGFLSNDFIELDNAGNEVVFRESFADTPVGYLRWNLSETGSLVTRRVFDSTQSSGQARRSCDPDSNSNCIVWDRRELIPFGVAGNRHYWLERRQTGVNAQTAFDPNGPVSLIPRYWDKE